MYMCTSHCVHDRAVQDRTLDVYILSKLRPTVLSCKWAARTGASGRPRGQFSGARVLDVLPDLGALNSRAHTFPERGAGFTEVQHITLSWDMGSETLNLISCEFKVWELTVGAGKGAGNITLRRNKKKRVCECALRMLSSSGACGLVSNCSFKWP